MKASDAIRHQLLKYLEDQANRTFSATTSAPPPPYTSNPSIPNTSRIPTMYPLKNTYYNEGYDYDYDWDEPSPTTISITIDSSITIDGDKNTVSVCSPQADALASNTTHSNTDSTNTNANAKASHVAHNPEQMSQLTTTILNALQSHGLTEEKGRKRPLTLTLKRGIVIKGSDNTVCRRKARLPVSSSSVYHTGDGDPIQSASAVSRRTCSVCISNSVISSQ